MRMDGEGIPFSNIRSHSETHEIENDDLGGDR
jgi:hypothetical protein